MAYFFKKFPQITYAFKDTPNDTRTVSNILTAFFLRRLSFEKSLVFQKYTVKDNDIPESLSKTLYNSTLYYWALLIINNIINPYLEWSLPEDILVKFVEEKYKDGVRYKKKDGTFKTLQNSQGIYGIHHFVNTVTERRCDDVEDEAFRTIYEEDPYLIGQNISPVTNLQYENELNLQRRLITIINPQRITRFEEDFIRMLKGISV